MINFYELSIANILGVNMVIDHCKDRLQGYKYHQMIEFIYTSKSLMAFSCLALAFFFEKSKGIRRKKQVSSARCYAKKFIIL